MEIQGTKNFPYSTSDARRDRDKWLPVLEAYQDVLLELELEVMKRILEGGTQREVAKQLGIAHSRVAPLFKKGARRIRFYIASPSALARRRGFKEI